MKKQKKKRTTRMDEIKNTKKKQLLSNKISNRYIESQITLTTRIRPAIPSNDNVLLIKQNLLDLNSESFELQTIKEYHSELRVTDQNKNEKQETSRLRIGKTFSKRNYPIKRKSKLYEKHILVTIPINYNKSRLLDKTSKKKYLCETKFTYMYDSQYVCHKSNDSVISKSSSRKNLLSLAFDEKLSSSAYSLLMKIHNRYIAIWEEVKKILHEDIISKRKVKHILKNYFFKKNLNKKIDSFCINNCCNTRKEKHYEIRNVKNNAMDLQYSKRTLEIEPTKSHSSEYNNFCKFQNIKMPYDTTDSFKEDLNQSALVCKFDTHSNMRSRSPSPALPLTREEALLNKHFIDSPSELSLIEKLEQLNSRTTYDLQFEKNLNCIVKNSNRPNLPNRLVLISESSKSDLLANAIFNKSSEHPLSVNEKVSYENDTTYMRSPINSNNCKCRTSNSFIRRKCATTTINKKTKLPENDNLSTSYFKSSLLKSLSSEISRSKTPLLNSLSHDQQQNLRKKERSVSVTKMTCNFSQTISQNSNFLLKRSCSKDSNVTSSSSQRCGRVNGSHSSESTSSVTCKTSRPASSDLSRSRSPSIPRRYGSPSFLERRRITSARKRPVPYHRPTPTPSSSQSSMRSSEYSSCSTHSCRSSQSESCSSFNLIS